MKNFLKFIVILFSTMSVTAIGAMRTSQTSGYYDDIPSQADLSLFKKTNVNDSNNASKTGYYEIIPTVDSNEPENRMTFINLAESLIQEAGRTKNLKEAYPKYDGAIAALKNVELNELLMLSVYNELLSRLATDKSNIVLSNQRVVNATIGDAQEYLGILKNSTKKNIKPIELIKLTELRRSILNNVALIKVQQLLFADQKNISTPNLIQAVQILSFLKSDKVDQQKFINNLIALAVAFILENEISSGGNNLSGYLSNAQEAVKNMDDMIDKKGLGYQRLTNALNNANELLNAQSE
ncbi:hypothetical protein HYX58_05895 [Candidatus Dependentiae bacterium]|nr:hypothetical protein [Candidatus Dependentiae bacterium]